VQTTAPESLILALRCNSLRLESRKAEFILLHCPNLDVTKFAADANYRVESILELARGNTEELEADGAEEDDSRTKLSAPGVPLTAEQKRQLRARSASSSMIGDGSDAPLSSLRMFDISLTLCKRYHPSLNAWEVYMERAKALFVHVPSVTRLRALIDDTDSTNGSAPSSQGIAPSLLLLPSLRDALLQNPIGTYTVLTSVIWPLLSGSDLARLSLVLDLALACFAHILRSYESAVSPFTSPTKKKNLVVYARNLQRLTDHKDLLEKVMSLVEGLPVSASAAGTRIARVSIDYKRLVSPSAHECIEQLRKLITEQNLFLVSRLCAKLHACSGRGTSTIAVATEDGEHPPPQQLFPLLHHGKPAAGSGAVTTVVGGGLSLIDIFNDASLPARSTSVSIAGAGVSADSPSHASSTHVVLRGPVIDTSLIARLFLSTSLRAHLDLLVSLPPAPAKAPVLASAPSVAGWFAHYASVLKRLSVSDYTHLVTEVVYAGADEPVERFSVNPLRVELHARMQVAQCAIKDSVATYPLTAVVASASAGSLPAAADVRTHSTDIDSAPLSTEARAQYHDTLQSAHTYLCVLLGLFDVRCLNATLFWSEVCSIRGGDGYSSRLHALMQRVVRAVATDPDLRVQDVKSLLSKISVQLDSLEYVSLREVARASEDDAKFKWKLIGFVTRCVEAELEVDRTAFHPASLRDINEYDSLVSDAALCVLAGSEETSVSVASHVSVLNALLRSYSLHISEEDNVHLSQVLLIFISGQSIDAIGATAASSTHSLVQLHLQYIRTQLHVLLQLEALSNPVSVQARSVGAGVSVQQPIHSTLREQLNGSAAMRLGLRRQHHTQLLILRCIECAYVREADVDAATIRAALLLADALEAPATRTTAIASLMQLINGSSLGQQRSIDVCTGIAAILHVWTIGTDAEAKHQQDVTADSAWSHFLTLVASRRHWQLLLSLYTPTADAHTGSFRVLSPLAAYVPHSVQIALYRQLLEGSPSKVDALVFGLSSSPAPAAAAVSLPDLALAHLLQLWPSLHAASPTAALDDRLLSLVLGHGFFLSTLRHAAEEACVTQFAVRRFQQSSEKHRRTDVATGSWAHCLAVLVTQQKYEHAAAIYYEAHRTHSRVHAYSGAEARSSMALLRSALQQAKQEGQRQLAEMSAAKSDAAASAPAHAATLARIESELNTYRAALSTILMDDFGN
jgi:hypothetical protein